MRSKGFEGMACSIAGVLDALGDRWAVLILLGLSLAISERPSMPCCRFSKRSKIANFCSGSLALAAPTYRRSWSHAEHRLSLSETQSCWQLISNRAMLPPYARGL